MSAKIKILEKSVALRIAAGEVIDRPASVLRELLDNSIDAGSTEISIYLKSSGMEEIRVIDNGSGMSREDLEICFLPHATSKIQQIEDIYKIFTLGFRGEALSSIASSARTEIISSTDDSGEGCKLVIDNSRHEITAARANKGTIVSVKELFHMFPARKKFLKSPAAETTLCKNVFLEKAASNPEITFRLFIEERLTVFLPSSSLLERTAGCYPSVFKELKMCSEVKYSESSFSIKGILNSPEITRKDRKYIHIYINGRRIQEYSLVQAVTYGYSSFIPGGVFPSAVIFIEIDPELVDFNIHPAKKEARIKNIRIIHHALSEAVAGKLKAESHSGQLELNKGSFTAPLQKEFIEGEEADSSGTADKEGVSEPSISSGTENNSGFSGFPFSSGNNISSEEYLTSAHSAPGNDEDTSSPSGFYSSEFEDDEIKSSRNSDYISRAYLSGRTEDKNSGSYNSSSAFYKKASENIYSDYENTGSSLNNQINRTETYKPKNQKTDSSFRYIGSLFNLFLICEKDDAMYLIDQHAAHEKIIFEKLCRSKPDIQPLLIPLYPEKPFTVTDKILNNYKDLGIIIEKDDTGEYFIDAMPSYFFEIKNDLLKIITDSPGNTDEIRKNLFATVSCKQAVKKGDPLTYEEAVKIITGAFNLEVPFCPHGRPVWKKISKQELLEEINRIV